MSEMKKGLGAPPKSAAAAVTVPSPALQDTPMREEWDNAMVGVYLFIREGSDTPRLLEEIFQRLSLENTRLRGALAEIGRVAYDLREELREARQSGIDDLFMALADLAHNKEVEANGPNPSGTLRSTHAVTLTMNEILHVKNKLEGRE